MAKRRTLKGKGAFIFPKLLFKIFKKTKWKIEKDLILLCYLFTFIPELFVLLRDFSSRSDYYKLKKGKLPESNAAGDRFIPTCIKNTARGEGLEASETQQDLFFNDNKSCALLLRSPFEL